MIELLLVSLTEKTEVELEFGKFLELRLEDITIDKSEPSSECECGTIEPLSFEQLFPVRLEI